MIGIWGKEENEQFSFSPYFSHFIHKFIEMNCGIIQRNERVFSLSNNKENLSRKILIYKRCVLQIGTSKIVVPIVAFAQKVKYDLVQSKNSVFTMEQTPIIT